jgi:hypothetical protein
MSFIRYVTPIAFLLFLPTLLVLGQPSWTSQGLIAYYPFDGNALDFSGNGHNGIGTDILVERDRFGIQGSAIEFNGKTSKIEVPDSPALNLSKGDFSILFWAKQKNHQVQAEVLIKRLYEPNTVDKGYSLRLSGKQNGMTWRLAEQLPSTLANHSTVYSQSIGYMGWEFFGVVFRASTNELKFFSNAKFQDQTHLISQPLGSDGAPMVFGTDSHPNLPYFYGGLLDDFRIYNRALSETECQNLLEYESQPRVQSDYEIIYEKLNWSDARKDAVSRGGHLAAITSQLEFEEMLNQLGESLDDLLWIGGFKNDLGEWGWVTGEEFSYSSWAGSAPNNIGDNESFVQIVTRDRGANLGSWNDHSDSSDLIFGESISGYILEKSKANGAASAVVEIVNGFVVGARVTNVGYGYITSPEVAISGESGVGAKARAVVSNGQVVSIAIISTGSGYHGDTQITIAPPPMPMTSAVAEAQIVNGFLVGLNVIEGGHGYENAPNVEVIGGSGDGATVQAFIDEGKVLRLEIISAGSGYTTEPIIRIDPPKFAPKMSIRVKQVEVNLQLVVGKRYTIESSQNFVDWQQTGPLFVAEEEFVSFKFNTDEYGNYFRVVEQP